MVSRSNLEKQLKKISFNPKGWGKSEIDELCNILMPEEEVDECVNGYYEAGFALLVATKDRLLLVDKKPLNYLTVEDMRFDMINEFDYSHRLFGAQIKISAGAKTLHFTSLNQMRLRRLLSFVQYRMTEIKRIQHSHQEAQKAHLAQMNQQLQMFLAMHQYQQQQFARQQLNTNTTPSLAGGWVDWRPVSAGQLGLSAMKRVLPVISAYTRLPLMSDRRRFQSTAP